MVQSAPLKSRGGERRKQKKKSTVSLAVMIAFCFLAFLSMAVFTNSFPIEIFYLIVAASLVAIVLYAKDKWAAVHGRWRVHESTLHAVALGGGWPGALIAQALFNHKRSKRRFIIAFWITVIVNSSLVLWIFTGRNGAQSAAVIAAIKNAVAG